MTPRAILLAGWLLAGVAPAQLPPLPDEVPVAPELGEPGSDGAPPVPPEASEGGAAAEEAGPVDEESVDDDLMPLPERWFEAYFTTRPERFLSDPQELLPPVERQAREDFLAYHASDSEIDLYVHLFDADQRVPREVRPEELAGRFFAEGKPALLLFYHLGRPDRAEAWLSPSLAGKVSDAAVRRLVQGSVVAAQAVGDPVDQLERFSVQTSIRIFWMEKEAGLSEREVAPAPSAGGRAGGGAPGEPGALRLFLEVWGLRLALGVSTAILILLGLLLVRCRARHRFPEFDFEPRLGGAHAAGVGAVIGFGDTTQGPARQRDEVPDCLGGL